VRAHAQCVSRQSRPSGYHGGHLSGKQTNKQDRPQQRRRVAVASSLPTSSAGDRTTSTQAASVQVASAQAPSARQGASIPAVAARVQSDPNLRTKPGTVRVEPLPRRLNRRASTNAL
jgi:hypothetical protein